MTDGTWEDILANVTMLRIDAEFTSGDDAFAFDNVELTPEPATLTLFVLGGMALVRRRKRGMGN